MRGRSLRSTNSTLKLGVFMNSINVLAMQVRCLPGTGSPKIAKFYIVLRGLASRPALLTCNLDSILYDFSQSSLIYTRSGIPARDHKITSRLKLN